MTENIELLNFIVQNTEMGIETIPPLLEKIEDKGLYTALDTQLREYETIHNDAKEFLAKEHENAKGIGEFAKLSSYIMINLKTLADKSSSHIAEMMIQGSTMGTIQITRNLNKYSDADSQYRKLAEKLLKTEETNIGEMKKFL
jgi:hypothetical protein